MDTVTTTFCGRRFSADELQLICSVVGRYPGLSRMELAHTVRELLQWTRPGGLKAGQCREFLELLDARGVLRLPAKHATKPVGARTSVPVSATGEPLVFRELVGPHHYLDHAVPFGAHLRYLIHSGQRVLGCLQFSSPAWRMAARDQWIGWDDEVRGCKLQQVVNNSRFLLLPWVRVENLASVVLSRALRRVREDWLARYAVEPLLAETLGDTSRFSGHCYKVANWLHLGCTTGRGRMDREHERCGVAVKSVWVYPLVRDAAQRLRG